jgi:threonine dehydrogenase-like Zn-dependent dehydrogenase
MRAVVCQNSNLDVVDLPTPEPSRGQVLLTVVRSGICGSDLHARRHADAQADVLAEAGYDRAMRSSQQVVMGHEFCGTVADYGPGCQQKVPAGTLAVALPLRRTSKGVDAIGISETAPGGYAEHVLVEESLMLAVPNGLAPQLAALTEPMAIGAHAVHRADIAKGDVAIVIGCGPVGLAVIAMLRSQGVRTIIASDLSPRRRALAQTMGAGTVVDPRENSPYDTPHGRRHLRTVPALVELAIGSMEKLRRAPIPWHVVLRLADRLGKATPSRPVVFECVGVPGMIDSIITAAPLNTRVVVVGVCMDPDTIRPVMAINKEVDLRFVFGYGPLEFRDTLHLLADGKLDVAPLITGTVALAGVAAAFDALEDPEVHAKILIDPHSDAPSLMWPRT